MTSFDALESSTESSQPYEIYRFAFGLETFLYTSNSVDVTIGADVYERTSIRRGRIVVGQTERKRVLEITVPLGNDFAERYIGVPPGQKANLTITRYQRSNPTVTPIKLFEGSVQSVRFPGDGQAVIAAQTLEGVVGRTMPKRSYMGMCNHTLYGSGCGVDPNSFRHTGTTTAVAGNTVTVSGVSSSGLDFTGGFISQSGVNDPRVVLKQAGDVLTLMIPFKANVMGALMEVFAGCDHLIDGDCSLVFDNVINHGGFPFVPSKNVFTDGIQ